MPIPGPTGGLSLVPSRKVRATLRIVPFVGQLPIGARLPRTAELVEAARCTLAAIEVQSAAATTA